MHACGPRFAAYLILRPALDVPSGVGPVLTKVVSPAMRTGATQLLQALGVRFRRAYRQELGVRLQTAARPYA